MPAANLSPVLPGTSRAASAGALAVLCVSMLVVASEATASQPPSVAAFERATDRVLDRVREVPLAAPPIGRAAEPLFPDHRYVTLYGAPQLVNTELGKRSPRNAARKVVQLSRSFERKGDRDVVSGFDLIAVVANSTPGPDRKYRTRQPDEIIRTYLDQARRFDGRLMLDIQPGRSTAVGEIRALAPWLAEPDVDVAIDPEWNVGRRGVPGATTGSITANEINAASRRLDRIVDDGDLPPKVLVVHQFTEEMIRRRKSIRQRDGVQVVLNFDGIGSRAPKEAGYAALATNGLFNGFSIFTALDNGVMGPGAILALEPVVDFLLYQ